jgi:hypothetical protein
VPPTEHRRQSHSAAPRWPYHTSMSPAPLGLDLARTTELKAADLDVHGAHCVVDNPCAVSCHAHYNPESTPQHLQPSSDQDAAEAKPHAEENRYRYRQWPSGFGRQREPTTAMGGGVVAAAVLESARAVVRGRRGGRC